MALVDRFGRPFTKLRLVVNDVCNYRCIFCHNEGQPSGVGRLLDAEDYGFLAEALAGLGVRDYKVTGGEPLLRSDVVEIVRRVSSTGSSVSVTTNGTRLWRIADELAEAGLHHINISIHSADPSKYAYITGGKPEWLGEVISAARRLRRLGVGVKLNAVVLRGINDSLTELRALRDLAASLDASIQLIELIPVGLGESVFAKLYKPIEEVVNALVGDGARPAGVRKDLHNRPVLDWGGVRVEVVKNWNNPMFCAGCTTMRLTSDGKLKPCLYAPPAADLYPAIKARDVERLVAEVRRVVALRVPRFR